jgi:S-adenosylhomocysteine hydrolase
MRQILSPNVTQIPTDQELMKMGETEVYNGVEELRALYSKGVKEFVVYTITSSSVTAPFDNKTGDYKVIVYSPVGKTGYNLTGKC